MPLQRGLSQVVYESLYVGFVESSDISNGKNYEVYKPFCLLMKAQNGSIDFGDRLGLGSIPCMVVLKIHARYVISFGI